MKRALITAAVAAVLLFAAPVALCVAGFALPPQFDVTYYGQLVRMADRLAAAEGKKMVFIGNSALAFGLRTDLVKEEFPDYTPVNFGLYGAIGTKAMLQLSQPEIGEGDVVIIAPEMSSQSMSTYFSARNLWMALDGGFHLLGRIDKKNAPAMAGNFPAFAAQKFKYKISGLKPKTDGVYARSSFDDAFGKDAGYMTYLRAYNVMAGGFDPNSPVAYSSSVIGEGFIDYVNAYCKAARKKGASVYFGFAPVNRLAVKSDASAAAEFYGYLNDNLDCAVVGYPSNYAFDYEYFYDSNAHMNSAGMYHYTYRLTEDVKAALGDSTPTEIPLPDKPVIPPDVGEEGEDKDLDCFVYDEGEDGVVITALGEKGKTRASLTLPERYNGKPVISFTADTFRGSAALTRLTLSKNLRVLYDGSFEGCTGLRELLLKQENPNKCGVGTGLLKGTVGCYVYVPADSLDLYATHYNWGGYAGRLKPYGA